MAINRVEFKDYLVFRHGFSAYFCPGVNVLIGANGTGKTTLLRCIYNLKHLYSSMIMSDGSDFYTLNGEQFFIKDENNADKHELDWGYAYIDAKIKNFVYIPEKDILEHARGLLTFIEQKQTGFGQVYKDILILAQDTPTLIQSKTQKDIYQKIIEIIGGEMRWDKSEGSFYTLKNDGSHISFANEASGFKKFGFLGLLVANGQLEPKSILLWDEPENSLNPYLIPKIVDILLELTRNGVQIFIATHSEILANYFAVNRQDADSVLFTSLYKDNEQIKTTASDRFDLLEPNNLTSEPIKLYEKEIMKGLGGNG